MKVKKIPKIIHYCWFGGKEKPTIVKKCIDSWKKHLIGYEIREWNESNFDISKVKFTRQAYDIGNYAFVSDYVRVYALYNYGGIYLDTDTEIFKSLNEFLTKESFWGFEEKNYVATSLIGAKRGNKLIGEFLEFYNNKSLIKEDASIDSFTNVVVVTKIVKKMGIDLSGSYQEIEGVCTVYPQEYFSPYDYINCYSKTTEKTYAIHHFYKSWLPLKERVKGFLKKIMAKIIGGHRIAKLRSLLTNN